MVRRMVDLEREMASVWRAVEGDPRTGSEGILARLRTIQEKQDLLIEEQARRDNEIKEQIDGILAAQRERDAEQRGRNRTLVFITGGSLFGIVGLIAMVWSALGGSAGA